MSEAIVSSVLRKITESVYQEALLLYGVGDKVAWAKRELGWVSAFLKDVDAKENKDASVKQWVNDVKEVARMIEDALDKFLVEMEGLRSKCVLRRVRHMPKAISARHKVGTEIDRIKERMREIKDNVTIIIGIMNIGSSSRGSSSRQHVRPVVIPEIDKTEVVGFQDDINNICEQLLDESILRRSVISIVGAGGLGKTTIAMKVYKSAGVRCHFDCRMWVTISQKFKLIDVFKKMLKKLQVHPTEIPDEEYFIIRELHESLSKKRYLIVLDDVWSSDLWTRLEVALPEDYNGSRVLITTRFLKVAEKSDAVNKPYELRVLSENESRQLLLEKIFPNQFANKCPDNLLPLTNLLAEKCGGWPLAVVVVGGILSTKYPDCHTWNDVMLKMDWHIEGSECLDIISTSYEDLPVHLKQCFTYISLFPEDFKIKAATLIQLWNAEGFIQPESTKTMEEIAENYLEELVQRCMVQVSKRSWSGKIKYCYIHDILRELAIHKVKEDNFFQSNANSTFYSNALTHHIAFHKYDNAESAIGSVGPNIRSLIYFGGHLPNYNELRMVRVLHLEYGGSLRDQTITGFTWMKNLSTLKYFRSNQNFKLRELPTSFWDNKMLRYVKIEGPLVLGPPSSANLENLLTLKGVVARNEWSEKLPHFPCIRKLWVFIAPGIDWKAMTSSISKLEHLNSLIVYSSACLSPAFQKYKQMHSLYMNFRWPRYIVHCSNLFPPHLAKLTLRISSLREDPMPELEKLPSLRVLRLLIDSYIGEQLICSAGRFRCLLELKLDYLKHLVELKVEEGAMPMLNLLEIGGCENLKMLPNLQYLTNLQELKLQIMSDHFCLRLKGADQHKVKHIPSIIVEKSL